MIKRTDPQYSHDLFETSISKDFAIETRHVNSGISEDGITHIHKFFEILFYYEGTRILTINDSQSILNKNKIAFIAPFKFHRTSNKVEDEPYKRILINFTPEFMNELNNVCDNNLFLCFNTHESCIHFRDDEVSQIEEILQCMLYEYNTFADKFSVNIIKAELMKLLIIASRNVANNRSESYPENANNSYFDLILKIAEFITKNYKNKITLDILEAEFGISKYLISRNFKNVMLMSLSDFINSIRIQEVKRLILESENNIASAAYECGFETLVHFNRVFKSTVGITAREYIKLKKDKKK